MTRDPSRIDPILARLRAAWIARPDLRLGQLLTASVEMRPALDDGPDARGLRLFSAECHEFGAEGAPIEWPAPPAAQPPPALDLDALAEAERAMTAGAWRANIFTTHVADSTQETQWHEAVVGSDVVCETECSVFEDETAIGAANIRGIVALRNAAPHLIAEARAAVALRSEVADLAAIRADERARYLRDGARHLAERDHALTALSKAKRLGLEACDAAQMSDDQMMWATINITAIRAALEAL